MAVDAARAKSLFLAASDLPDAADRAAYLDRECGGDAELRARVEALLRADEASPLPPAGAPGASGTVDLPGVDSATGTVARPPSSSATGNFGPDRDIGTFASTPARREHATTLGTVIAGRYALVEVIGEGGMGSVYLASQSEPVKRQVALKLIKAGMDSKAVLARFDAERQALALMDHPNIARIYDGGVTPAGQPFFVMELVKGVPLTEYCDAHRLSVDARLQLFVQVCNAVQHAHQKGIIHRDLKPGNVLVTEVDGRPTPKVIDFGVAKATELKLTDLSFSDTGAIVGTPAYMSPEQADPSSMDIDTRSDVYALGVLLYELLTGSPPIDRSQFKRGALLEMLRMVREVEPPKPSTKLSTADALPNIAANRHVDPAQLVRALRGDLDWIVMKALEKDRTRRYETATGFAADVLRHLSHEPVLAAPPGRGYRLRKFVRKNRGPVIATGLVFAVLIAGITGTAVGLLRAIDAEKQAKQDRDEAITAKEAESAALAEVTKARNEEASALAKATTAKNEETKARQDAEKAARDARDSFNGFSDTVTLSLYLPFMRDPTPTEKAYLDRLARYYTEAAQVPGETPEAWTVRGQARYYLALLATLQNDEAGLVANLGPAEELLGQAANASPNDAIVHRYLGLTRSIRIGKETTDRFREKLSKNTAGKPPPSAPLRYILTPIPIEGIQNIYEIWRDLARRFPEDPVTRSRAAESAGQYAQTLFGSTPQPSTTNLPLHATLELCLQARDEEVKHRRWIAARESGLVENWAKLRQALNSGAEAGIKLWLCKPGEVPIARRVLDYKRESYRVLYKNVSAGRDAQLTEFDSYEGVAALNNSLLNPDKWPDASVERATFWSGLLEEFPKSRALATQVFHAKLPLAERLIALGKYADAQVAWRDAVRVAKDHDTMITKGPPTLQRDADGRLRPVEGKLNPAKGMEFLQGLFPIIEKCLTAKQYDTARLAASDLVNEMEALAALAKEPGIILSQQMTRAYDLLGRSYIEDGRIDEFIAVERRRIAAITANASRVPHVPFQRVMFVAGAHERLGMNLLKHDRPAEAVVAFRDTLDVFRKEFDIWAKLGGAIDPNTARLGADTAWRVSFELRKRDLPEWREFLRSAFELDTTTKGWKARTPPWELPRYYGHVSATSGDYAEALRAYREGMTRDWPLGSNPDVKDTPEVRAAKRREQPLDQWAGIVLALDGKPTDAIKEIPAPGTTSELADYVRAALPALAGKPEDSKRLFAELLVRDGRGNNPFAVRELARMAAAVGPESGIDAAELVRLAESGKTADDFAWGHHFVALAHLRAENFDRAAMAVTESREINPRWQPALNNLVLALIAQKRGRLDIARVHLTTASATPVPFGALPIDVVEYRLLLTEARRLIPHEIAPPPREK